jgi:hypothetical protein
MKRRISWVTGAVVALVLGLGVGAALAYFLSHGSGSGSATTGSLSPVTVASATVSPNTPLLPGRSGDVVLDVKNPNSVAVTLISVAANGTVTTSQSGCTTTGVTFNNESGLGVNIPANSTTPVDLSGAATMSTSSSNGCQGATFSIPVSITVHEG